MLSGSIDELERAVQSPFATQAQWQEYFEACDITGEEAKIRFVEKCQERGVFKYSGKVLLEMLSERAVYPAYVCFDYSALKDLPFRRLVFSQGWPVRMNELAEVIQDDRSFLRYVHFSRGGTEVISEFQGLERLAHSGRRSKRGKVVMTDCDAARIAQVRSLQSVNLEYSDVTDKGAAGLVALPKLRRLHLDYSLVGDETLKALCEKGVASISLKGTRVSDDGARYIAQNRANLTHLSLADCKRITRKGVDALCKSEYKAPHTEGLWLKRRYDRR